MFSLKHSFLKSVVCSDPLAIVLKTLPRVNKGYLFMHHWLNFHWTLGSALLMQVPFLPSSLESRLYHFKWHILEVKAQDMPRLIGLLQCGLLQIFRRASLTNSYGSPPPRSEHKTEKNNSCRDKYSNIPQMYIQEGVVFLQQPVKCKEKVMLKIPN